MEKDWLLLLLSPVSWPEPELVAWASFVVDDEADDADDDVDEDPVTWLDDDELVTCVWGEAEFDESASTVVIKSFDN